MHATRECLKEVWMLGTSIVRSSRVLKSKIQEKRKLLHDSYMKNINESYWNKKSEFWRFVHSRQVSDNKKKIESLRDINNECVSNINNDKI